MSFTWQNSVVIAIVAAAGFFIFRKLWRAVLSSGSSCGACGSCAAPKKEVVQIEIVKRP